jgi:hypothetical protein
MRLADSERAALVAERDELRAEVKRAEALLESTRRVLGYRERELLDLKGPCSTCRLHHAHSGPCDTSAEGGA